MPRKIELRRQLNTFDVTSLSSAQLSVLISMWLLLSVHGSSDHPLRAVKTSLRR